MKLSVLIPTVTDRSKQFNALCDSLHATIDEEGLSGQVEVAFIRDNKEMTIGEKREKLYQMANGEYSIQLDDDDRLAGDAIGKILAAMNHDPDCITFQEHCTIDGGFFSSNHSLFYIDWEGNGDQVLADGFHYHRTPYFKDVIKTAIARSVPIPHERYGEDHMWARALKPHLRVEAHIDEYLYYYQHTSSDHNERYGIKQE